MLQTTHTNELMISDGCNDIGYLILLDGKESTFIFPGDKKNELQKYGRGRRMTSNKQIEHIAKTMFHLSEFELDFGKTEWPDWLNEDVKDAYRRLAKWHHDALRKERKKVFTAMKRLEGFS